MIFLAAEYCTTSVPKATPTALPITKEAKASVRVVRMLT